MQMNTMLLFIFLFNGRMFDIHLLNLNRSKSYCSIFTFLSFALSFYL